jgi:tetratricopeptide (TPR) repeat protein
VPALLDRGILAALALAGSCAAEPASPPPADGALSCWRQIDDGYFTDTPSQVAGGLARLDALKGSVVPEAYLYVRAYGLYRLVSISSRKDLAKARLEEADRLLSRPPPSGDPAEFHALRAAVDGELAGLGSMMLGMRFGMASKSEADKAVALEPANGRALLCLGEVEGNTPAQFGGSTAAGIAHLKEAAAALAANPGTGVFGWGAADAYAFLGIFYERRKDPADAREAFASALRVRPDYYWVANVLIPRLEGRPVRYKFPKGQQTD